MATPPQTIPLTNTVTPQHNSPTPPTRVANPEENPEAPPAPSLRVEPPGRISLQPGQTSRNPPQSEPHVIQDDTDPISPSAH